MAKNSKKKTTNNNQAERNAEREKRIASKKKSDFLHVDGHVVESLPAGTFKVQLENGHEVLAHLAGKLRMFHIRILPGDKVKIEMTPYDLNKGRVVYRY